MDAGTDRQVPGISVVDGSKEGSQGSEDLVVMALVESKKESRLKVATVLILCLFNLTYYMDRFGIAGKLYLYTVSSLCFIDDLLFQDRHSNGHSMRSGS